MKPIGRTRRLLAKKLQKAFPILRNMEAHWEPESLYPALGAYRTDTRIDCCRWEGIAYHIREDGSRFPIIVVMSYHTMTDVLKAKELEINNMGEIFIKEDQ